MITFEDHYFVETNIEVKGKPTLTQDEGHLEDFISEINSEDIQVIMGSEKLIKTIGNIDYTESEYDAWRFLYRDDGKIVGAVQGVTMSNGDKILSNIYVIPEYRRQGIGTELVNTAKNEFTDMKLSNDFTKTGAKFFGVKV